MHIKICGVRSTSELALLDRYGIDFAGLWWKVPMGAHNLSTQDLVNIAASASGHTRPMVVTLGAPFEAAVDVLLETGIRAMQLHGFELPGAVGRLKAAIPDLEIFKTLHVKDGRCLEHGMIKAYRDVGVDVFIADTFLSSSAVGSTGIAIPDTALEPLLAATQGTPIMLAGGINAHRITRLNELPGLWGVDIDSAARMRGQIDAVMVAELVEAAHVLYGKAPAYEDLPILATAA